jgi:uncharacterized protein (TIGR02996 family)
MSKRSAFLDAIVATPDDDAPRLVFADWLEDHGNEHAAARAAFIRVQCEAAKLAHDDPRLPDLRRREDELLREHGRFFSPLEEFQQEWRLLRGDARSNYPYAGHLHWHRGFPRWLSVPAQDYPSRMEAILNEEAVFDVSLQFYGLGTVAPERDAEWLDPLLASPRLGLIGMLDLCDTMVCVDSPPSRFLRVVQAPGLTGLKHVFVAKDFIGLPGVRGLLDSPAPFVLRSLYLSCFIEPEYAEVDQATDFLEAVRLIAQSPRLASLEALKLDCYFDAEGRGEDAARRLLESPHLPQGMELRFDARHELTDGTRAALAERFRLASDA